MVYTVGSAFFYSFQINFILQEYDHEFDFDY